MIIGKCITGQNYTAVSVFMKYKSAPVKSDGQNGIL